MGRHHRADDAQATDVIPRPLLPAPQVIEVIRYRTNWFLWILLGAVTVFAGLMAALYFIYGYDGASCPASALAPG